MPGAKKTDRAKTDRATNPAASEKTPKKPLN
jgi:hypothetical protein